MKSPIDGEKTRVAEAAAQLAQNGMRIGLGAGSTVALFVRALAQRRLSLRCVAASPATEALAREVGLTVEPFDQLAELDLVVDGADQIAPDGWLVKGGGAAHTREKIVASAGKKCVAIADASKRVATLHGPVPIELLSFGLPATLRRLEPTKVRSVPLSADGGVIADYHGSWTDPAKLAAWLEATPGLVGHGLFPPTIFSEALVARGDSVERLVFSR